jgi:hypothetical protein
MVWTLDLLTPLGTASNYSATAYLPSSQFTTATSSSLATASNSGDFSASRAQVLPSPTLIQNCLPAISSTELDRHLF